MGCFGLRFDGSNDLGSDIDCCRGGMSYSGSGRLLQVVKTCSENLGKFSDGDGHRVKYASKDPNIIDRLCN